MYYKVGCVPMIATEDNRCCCIHVRVACYVSNVFGHAILKLDMAYLCWSWLTYVGHDTLMLVMTHLCWSWHTYVGHDIYLWRSWHTYVGHDTLMLVMAYLCWSWHTFVGHALLIFILVNKWQCYGLLFVSYDYASTAFFNLTISPCGITTIG